jgi:hypothetical protein
VTSTGSTPLEQALRRRTDLLGAAGRLEASLSSAVARPAFAGDVHRAMQELRACLGAHVANAEGDEGLFSEVLAVAPRLAHQIDVLRKEHEEIDVALAHVQRIDDPTTLREEGTAVLARVVRHRQRGADLLYEAYEVDVGAMD